MVRRRPGDGSLFSWWSPDPSSDWNQLGPWEVATARDSLRPHEPPVSRAKTRAGDSVISNPPRSATASMINQADRSGGFPPGPPLRGVPSGRTKCWHGPVRVRQSPGLSSAGPTGRRFCDFESPSLRHKESRLSAALVAERGGFEPPVLVYPIHSLSRRARSATPASLQGLPDYRWERIGTRLLAQNRAQPSRWRHGGMAERFKATVLKTVVGVSSPRVRISLPPPPQRLANAGRLHEGVVGARFEVTESLVGSRRPQQPGGLSGP